MSDNRGQVAGESRFSWDASRATGGTARVRVALDGCEVEVMPLWVAVHQDRVTGLARCEPGLSGCFASTADN